MSETQGFDRTGHTHHIGGSDIKCTLLTHCPSICDCPVDECTATKVMTKTEVYGWLARAREDVLDAKMLTYNGGSRTNLREACLDAVGALTMILDALEDDGIGINGITD